MVNIMETLESLDGGPDHASAKSGAPGDAGACAAVDAGGQPTAAERARDLFEALDKDGDGLLTKEEFVQGLLVCLFGSLEKKSCSFCRFGRIFLLNFRANQDARMPFFSPSFKINWA